MLASDLVESTPDGDWSPNIAMTGPLSGTPETDGLVTNSVMDSQPPGHEQYLVTGKVGTDVAAVAFENGGTYVQATVRDGWFAAWWPKVRPDSILERIVRSGPPNPDVRITLKDGSTRTAPIQDFDISPL